MYGNKKEHRRLKRLNPAGIHLLKVNNRSTQTRCEICFKLTIRTPSIGNFEYVIADWENEVINPMTVGLHLTASLVFQMDVCIHFQGTEMYSDPSQTSKTELFVKIWRKMF